MCDTVTPTVFKIKNIYIIIKIIVGVTMSHIKTQHKLKSPFIKNHR